LQEENVVGARRCQVFERKEGGTVRLIGKKCVPWFTPSQCVDWVKGGVVGGGLDSQGRRVRGRWGNVFCFAPHETKAGSLFRLRRKKCQNRKTLNVMQTPKKW